MLWLALHLPRLGLDLLERAGPADAGPLILWQGEGKGRFVVLANGQVQALGIRPGMSLDAALAVAPGLLALPRDRAAEEGARRSLAEYCLRFSPLVVLPAEDSAAVALEIEGSAHLFGGAEALLARISAQWAGEGYAIEGAIGPTLLGAWLLARWQTDAVCCDRETLRRRLLPLPLAFLPLPAETAEGLSGLGLRGLGDLLRLPREGLARRFGPELLLLLERILGLSADPRPPFVAPEQMEARLDLPAELESAEALQFPLRRLLRDLALRLENRGEGARRLRLVLHHREGETGLVLELRDASRDEGQFRSLMRLRLEGMGGLPGPVRAITLAALERESLAARSLALLEEGEEMGGLGRFLERLQARLGTGAVQGLSLVAEHRPERAWCASPPALPREEGHEAPRHRLPGRRSDPAPMTIPARPLWLLQRPEPLTDMRLGALRLLGTAERIESGWWDGDDQVRDYHPAREPEGGRLWIYRDLRGGGWFLHGFFA